MKLVAFINILLPFFMFDQLQGQPDFANSFDSILIVYEVHGDGILVLIFVHGWSCDRGYWKD